jgi:hypothetical protein
VQHALRGCAVLHETMPAEHVVQSFSLCSSTVTFEPHVAVGPPASATGV